MSDLSVLDQTGTGGFRRLRPGPGHSRASVEADQRRRIQRAILEITDTTGFASVTLRRLTRLAGVSSGTFYALFDGKEEGFAEACGLVLQRCWRQAAQSRDPDADLDVQLATTFEQMATALVRDPVAARVALVAYFDGGPAALGSIDAFENSLVLALNDCLNRREGQYSETSIRWVISGWLRTARNSDPKFEGIGLPAFRRWARDCIESPSASEPRRSVERRAEARADHGDIALDDRGLLIAGAVRSASEDGYWSLTVSRICAAAGISQRRFLEQFADSDECLLAATDHLASRFFRKFTSTPGPGEVSEEWTRACVADVIRTVVQAPDTAAVLFSKIVSAGLRGMTRREQLIGEIAAAWRSALPDAFADPEATWKADIGIAGLWGEIAKALEEGRPVVLERREETLGELLEAPMRSSAPAI